MPPAPSVPPVPRTAPQEASTAKSVVAVTALFKGPPAHHAHEVMDAAPAYKLLPRGRVVVPQERV